MNKKDPLEPVRTSLNIILLVTSELSNYVKEINKQAIKIKKYLEDNEIKNNE